MRITVGELRRIIHEVVKQQTAKPGGVVSGWGGELDDEDQERLAYGGFRGVDEADEDESKNE